MTESDDKKMMNNLFFFYKFDLKVSSKTAEAFLRKCDKK